MNCGWSISHDGSQGIYIESFAFPFIQMVYALYRIDSIFCHVIYSKVSDFVCKGINGLLLE